ncbi:MAG: hypothetical protein WC679_09945 [Bacteroidales bacterium]|jgi:hypothetical protein
MAKKEIFRKILASCMLILFVAFYANNNLFEHVHIINGTFVVHSHFHTDKHHSTKSGNHTTKEVTLIAHVSNLQILSPNFFYSDFKPFICETDIFFQKPTGKTNFGYVGFISLRAPPVYNNFGHKKIV